MQKRYLIVTCLQQEKKFHYPLPLGPVDVSEAKLLDKETIKFIISQTTQLNKGFRSAQSFFSVENPLNPQVAENKKLRQRLEMLR